MPERYEHEESRRRFVQAALAAISVAVLPACSEAGGDRSTDASSAGGVGGSAEDGGLPGEPVWTTVPPLVFVQGIASSISIAEYVSDPEGDALTIAKNDAPLPPGVTFDAEGMRFVYDGIGAVGSTSGHVLTADDG